MKTILVIEDNAGVRLPLVDTLHLEGYEVLEAVDGASGLKTARDKRPDLIVCDIMLPKLDGFDVLTELRKEMDTSVIPFIFLTALDSPHRLKEGYRLGADDYITKPYDRELLLDRIRMRLDKADRYCSSLNEVRSKLIGMAPHEFNTPLAGILGFASLLKDHSASLGPAEVSDYASLIYESGSRLLKTVMNYIRYLELQALSSQPEALARYADFRMEAPGRVVEQAFKSLMAVYAERSQDVSLNVENASLCMQESDFRMIVEALLGNALKFSDLGQQVFVRSVELDGYYRLSVQDRGVGISEKDLPCLEAFTQLNRGVNEQQGLGLGLAIVKGLCQIYGARFFIRSETEEGTVVGVEIRLDLGGV